MYDPLSKLFGSQARIKLLRLFLFNTKQSFSIPEIAQRARVLAPEVRRELQTFESINLVTKSARGKGIRYTLAPDFQYTDALQTLLLNASTRGDHIVSSMKGLGVIKFVVLSGIFLGEWNGALDMLIVGDKMQERKLYEQVKKLESELGRELRFSLLSTENFLYRLNMNDRLIRDIIDYPHRIVLDKLNIGLK